MKTEVWQMIEELNKKEEILRSELLDLEKNFSAKKEEYLRVQGAIEALTIVQEN